jgi:hypothetical protein
MTGPYDHTGVHQWVTVELPKIESPHRFYEDLWNQVHKIVLHTGDYVWIGADWGMIGHPDAKMGGMVGHPDVKMVSDGRSDGMNGYLQCVLSVPESWCEYHTEEEAEEIGKRIEEEDDKREEEELAKLEED